MRLVPFIIKNKQQIISEWEAFGATLLGHAHGMTQLNLRDGIGEILDAIAIDISSASPPQPQSDKVGGLMPEDLGVTTAATAHGALRHGHGFNLDEVTAEFRSFRTSVLRLWMAQLSRKDHSALNDMLRFNEAVDQALAASIEKYTAEVSLSRDTFIAILGHDLRSPLSAIALSAEFLSMPSVPEEKRLQSTARISSSAAAMNAMIKDMLFYAQSRLGGGIPIAPHPVTMSDICQAALDVMRTTHPGAMFQFEISGNLDGHFDSARLQQVLSNLLNNAVQHGTKGSVVTLVARGEDGSVTIQVKNYGPPIPSELLERIFNPFVQVSSTPKKRDKYTSTSLGLGLFIAREIVLAHGGTIDVKSNDVGGTIFTVTLPRCGSARATG